MAKWRHNGGGRYSPPSPTPGLRAALAAKEAAERAIKQRLAEQAATAPVSRTPAASRSPATRPADTHFDR